jgi:hypothetical protein
MLSLGLVESQPEDPDLATEYEVLMAKSSVLAAVKSASRGPLAAKVERSTLHLSALGTSLWEATIRDDGSDV